MIGDRETARHGDGAGGVIYNTSWNFERWESHDREAEAFGKVFENYGSASKAFELICFQRWFVLLNYAESHGIKRFWTFDWDVLVFTSLAEAQVSVGMTTPLHVFYCQDTLWLRQWTEMIHQAFRDRNLVFRRWWNFYANEQWPLISDMMVAHDTLPHLNVFTDPGSEWNKYSAWDNNVTTSQRAFEMTKKVGERMKYIRFDGGIPFAYHKKDHRDQVSLKCLHCWGPAKSKMKYFLEEAYGS